jgi:hypothetical protein
MLGVKAMKYIEQKDYKTTLIDDDWTSVPRFKY